MNIPHNKLNLPEMEINEGTTKYNNFITFMKQVNRYPSYDLSTYPPILPNKSSQNTLLLHPTIEEGDNFSYTRTAHQTVGHIT